METAAQVGVAVRQGGASRSVRSFPADERLDVRIASRRTEFARAWRLLYRAYREKEYVPQHPSRMYYRLSYGLSSSRTFIATDARKRLAGTLTLVGDNPLGLPMESLYHAEVQRLREKGKRIAEISGLAVEPQLARRSAAIFYVLTRFMVQFSCWHEYDDLVIAVHPRQEPFYRRWFKFEQIGECRPYNAVSGHPAVACRLRLNRVLELWNREVLDQYFARAIAVGQLERDGMEPAEHEYFCRLTGKVTDASGAISYRRAG